MVTRHGLEDGEGSRGSENAGFVQERHTRGQVSRKCGWVKGVSAGHGPVVQRVVVGDRRAET